MGIGNTLGRYFKSSEATKKRRYTSYGWICVYMDVSKGEDWTQTIDYEHIPFHCRKCHEHGHLFWDFPLNVPTKKGMEDKMKDRFTQVSGRKKKFPKRPN
jgi:hypothetical protein